MIDAIFMYVTSVNVFDLDWNWIRFLQEMMMILTTFKLCLNLNIKEIR